ncbi:hypothetical protein DC498_03345 [Terrimonas sp.]|nr:hypothetical protein DC498_03345 [Terrimonas sp.]
MVSPKAKLKKCEAYFFKRQKDAAFRLRSPPAVEAKGFVKFNYGETAAWFLKNLIQNPWSNLITKA